MRERIKNHPRAVGICALVLVLIAAALWYTRPVSFAELTPGFDRSTVGQLSARYDFRTAAPDGNVDSQFLSLDFEQGDPLIEELLDILDSYTYRRSLFGLLPHSSSRRVRNDGWFIRADGDSWCYFSLDHLDTGMYLRFTTPEGEDMKGVYVAAVGQKQFDAEIHGLLAEHTPAE